MFSLGPLPLCLSASLPLCLSGFVFQKAFLCILDLCLICLDYFKNEIPNMDQSYEFNVLLIEL